MNDIATEAKMVTHTLNHDQTTQWSINQDNATWTLAANTKLSVYGPAVLIGSGFDGNTININGHINATGGEGVGIYDQGSIGTTINVGAKGEVNGVLGIYSNGINTIINNKGEIDANTNGIYLQGDAHVENNGKIEGLYAVTLGSSAPNATMATSLKTADFHNIVVNHDQGEISGASVGVALNGNLGTQELINDGFISGGDAAVYVTTMKAHIVNNGTIEGIVTLSDENDVIDTRLGVIDGEVRGRLGNDTYIVSKAPVSIVENMNGGYDTVKSDASHSLAANVEKLVLIGKGDIVGKGNAGDNFLQGNTGDNQLKGLAGADIMNGGKGSDFLTGGAGDDTFVFNKGDGKDTVTDFHHGTDGITLFNFTGAANFDDISSHMADHGKDLWITYGSDTLILKGVHEAQLDANDFNFPVVI
jgi:Ca2+-binding RTX toxin-like protein